MVKTKPIPCSKEEMNALIEASSDDEFYHMLFVTAKLTGRRLGEYYNTKVSAFDRERKILNMPVFKRKREGTREAILTDEVAKLIYTYILRHRLKDEDYLFREKSYRSIQHAATKYAKKAGFKNHFSFHGFRHYFVTEFIKAGWAYDKISKLTGHSSPNTLVHYDHASSAFVRDEALDALRNM